MNETERILALDAALCACEGIGGLQIHLAALQKAVENKLAETNLHCDIEEYLAEQQDAVKKLAANPQCFGGEPL